MGNTNSIRLLTLLQAATEVDRQERTQANANSLFLKKFPAEIRNKIYDLALGPGDAVSIAKPKNSFHWRTDESRGRKRILTPSYFKRIRLGITQTCRQIRDETLPMLYARTVFRAGESFTVDHFNLPILCDSRTVGLWLAGLSPEAVQALAKLEVQRMDGKLHGLLGEFDVKSGGVKTSCFRRYNEDCSGAHANGEEDVPKVEALAKVPDEEESSEEKIERILGLLEKF